MKLAWSSKLRFLWYSDLILVSLTVVSMALVGLTCRSLCSIFCSTFYVPYMDAVVELDGHSFEFCHSLRQAVMSQLVSDNWLEVLLEKVDQLGSA